MFLPKLAAAAAAAAARLRSPMGSGSRACPAWRAIGHRSATPRGNNNTGAACEGGAAGAASEGSKTRKPRAPPTLTWEKKLKRAGVKAKALGSACQNLAVGAGGLVGAGMYSVYLVEEAKFHVDERKTRRAGVSIPETPASGPPASTTPSTSSTTA